MLLMDGDADMPLMDGDGLMAGDVPPLADEAGMGMLPIAGPAMPMLWCTWMLICQRVWMHCYR